MADRNEDPDLLAASRVVHHPNVRVKVTATHGWTWEGPLLKCMNQAVDHLRNGQVLTIELADKDDS